MNEAAWIIDQLVLQGVSHFCIAPGSRSTPLVLAAADHPDAQTHVHFDERGLAFFALGLSQGLRVPAALISTSGTAAGNLLPAVMEAHQTQTPLILLTADRPHELRDCGANQTTDQIKLFQPFVRWQCDLPSALSESYFRSAVAQALFHATQNPPGPVHLNCPLREPFSLQKTSFSRGKSIPLHLSSCTPATLPSYRSSARGVLLVGRLPHPDDIHPILSLAKRLQWPVCADILSNARCTPTPEQIRHYDWIFKRGCPLKPDLILHFGERLTSKKSLDWIRQDCPYVHVGPYPHLLDPARRLTARIQSDAAPFCFSFEASTDPDWLPSWKTLDEELNTLVSSHFASAPQTEASAHRALSKLLPPHTSVFLGNGMPIRDADHFLFPERARGFFSNRGLSGIDGNIATAAGLAQSTPLLALIGDQACLHDLNSLPLLNSTPHPLILIASNNFGSGIFHHLPIATSPHFERYFAAPHNWTFEKAAEMFGIPYHATDSLASIPSQTCLIELFTDRAQNHQFQKDLEASCLHALT